MKTKKHILITDRLSKMMLLMALTLTFTIGCEEVDYTFVPEPIEQHTIEGITPTTGDIGTVVIIVGTNFSPTPSNNKVSFGGVIASVTSATPTMLTVAVPESAPTGAITINHSSFAAEGPVFTVVDIPTIISVDPFSAIEGEAITITGTKFGASVDGITVMINGVLATVNEITETGLTTSVPVGSNAGIGEIMVTVNEQTASFPGFTIVPNITAFTPLSGEEGAEVIITGTGFSTIATDNILDFNGSEALVTTATNTRITTTVPVGATSGLINLDVAGQNTSTSVVFTVGRTPTTLVIPLASGDDDVEEVAEADGTAIIGQMDITGSDLEFGEISSGDGLQNIGLRFTNLDIPQGASISEARIQFMADNIGADPVELTIFGENVANAAGYEDVVGNLSARALTTASTVWNIEPWIAVGDRLPAQQTVDLSAIIQEIVNRADWAAGNSINFIMKHSGVSVGVTSSSGGREAEDYSSSSPEDGAELTLTFQ